MEALTYTPRPSPDLEAVFLEDSPESALELVDWLSARGISASIGFKQVEIQAPEPIHVMIARPGDYICHTSGLEFPIAVFTYPVFHFLYEEVSPER